RCQYAGQSRTTAAVPAGAEPADRRVEPADDGVRALPGTEVESELPRPAIAARRYGKPHRRGAARLHRGGGALQHRDPHLPRTHLAHTDVQRHAASRELRGHRRERRAGAASAVSMIRSLLLSLVLLGWAGGPVAQQPEPPTLTRRAGVDADSLDTQPEAR